MIRDQKLKLLGSLSLLWTLLFGCTPFAWSAPQSGGHSDIKAATSFLKGIIPGMTFVQCKRILPVGARIEQVRWGQDFDNYGNIAKISGSISGYLVIATKQQLKIDKPKDFTNAAYLAVHGSDPIRAVKPYMDTSEGSKAVNYSRIRAISRFLGKPLDASFVGDPEDSSWTAHWRTRHNLTVEYSRQAELVNSYGPIPVLMAWTQSSSK